MDAPSIAKDREARESRKKSMLTKSSSNNSVSEIDPHDFDTKVPPPLGIHQFADPRHMDPFAGHHPHQFAPPMYSPFHHPGMGAHHPGMGGRHPGMHMHGQYPIVKPVPGHFPLFDHPEDVRPLRASYHKSPGAPEFRDFDRYPRDQKLRESRDDVYGGRDRESRDRDRGYGDRDRIGKDGYREDKERRVKDRDSRPDRDRPVRHSQHKERPQADCKECDNCESLKKELDEHRAEKAAKLLSKKKKETKSPQGEQI